MTNSPPFDQQLALNAYWKGIGGDVMLPGTIRASDRFVRASYYVDALPDDASGPRAIAAVFSVAPNKRAGAPARGRERCSPPVSLAASFAPQRGTR